MLGPSDVIVVGAGIIGCAVAEELARRGASVEIVDDRPIGMGATQASAGVLAPYIEAREDGPLFDLTVRSLDLFDQFVARVSEDAGVAVPYRRTGTIDIATSEPELRELEARAAMLARRGVTAHLLDVAATRAEEPLVAESAVGGALEIGLHGFVAAGELTRALVGAARRHGAQLLEPSRVRRIEEAERRPDRRYRLRLADRQRGGRGRRELVGRSSDRWRPRPAAGPAGAQPASVARLDRRAAAACHLESPHYYIVPWDDGTLLVGATVEEAGFDERTTVAGVTAICSKR